MPVIGDVFSKVSFSFFAHVSWGLCLLNNAISLFKLITFIKSDWHNKRLTKRLLLSTYLSSHFFACSHLNTEHFSNNLKTRSPTQRI